jgi:glycerophosphoryl diester phosphodiesterase
MKLIGHRGAAAHAPENTLASIRRALSAGVFGVEWDVRVARCGTPVGFHDAALERTTNGRGALADHPFEALQALDAGGWFGEAFRGERIPTLEAALQLCLTGPRQVGPSQTNSSQANSSQIDPRQTAPRQTAPDPVRVYPELKALREPGDLDTLARVFSDTGALDRITVISMDPALLTGIRARLPDIQLGWVVERESRMEAAMDAVRLDPNALLDPDYKLLLANPRRTEAWVREGIPMATWTVNDPAAARALLELGVTHLTTDDPDGLRDPFVEREGGS